MRPGITHIVLLLVLPCLAVASDTGKILEISGLWINEAPPVAKIHAAYLNIRNTSDEDITLERIESADYERVEIHESIVNKGRASMKAHDVLEVKANSTLKLQPGGFHLMLFTPSRRMLAGDSSSFTFYFDNHTQLVSSARVKKLAGTHSSHKH